MNTNLQSFPPLRRIPICIDEHTRNNHRNKKAIIDKLFKVPSHQLNPEENRHQEANIRVKYTNWKPQIKMGQNKKGQLDQQLAFKKQDGLLRQQLQLQTNENSQSTFCQSKSVILIPKPVQQSNIVCKFTNFTDNYVTKYRKVKKQEQIVNRNLMKQLEALNNQSKMASTVCTKSILESACNLGQFTFNTKQHKSIHQIESPLKQCEPIKRISFNPFQFPQPQPPKRITERWSLTRRVKTETSAQHKKYEITGVNCSIQEPSSIYQVKQPGRYSYRQLRPLPRTQTQKTIAVKQKQPSQMILKQNSETNLLYNPAIKTVNKKEESEEQKLKVIRQQLNQVYKNRPKSTSEAFQKANGNNRPSVRSGLNIGRSSYRDSMQQFYKSYLLQGRNQKFGGHSNPFEGKV